MNKGVDYQRPNPDDPRWKLEVKREWEVELEELKDGPPPPPPLMWAVTYKCRPTFYLDPHVSGITSADHARRIAADVMGVSDPDNVSAHRIDIRN